MEFLIYTVGHSNLPLAEFIGLLKYHAVDMLYDIRSVPYSRFPQFNRERLTHSLESTGIHYAFHGDVLGGRINDPGCFKARQLPEQKINIAELVDYEQLIMRDWFQTGINDLINIAQLSKTAIMCSEENPIRCHRHLLVARRLIEMGGTVKHIRKDSGLELANFGGANDRHQPSLF